MSEPHVHADQPATHDGDAPASSPDVQALLADWRAHRAAQTAPLRRGFIEALARRAEVRAGSVRELLDARLAQLLQAEMARREEGSPSLARQPHKAMARRDEPSQVPSADPPAVTANSAPTNTAPEVRTTVETASEAGTALDPQAAAQAAADAATAAKRKRAALLLADPASAASTASAPRPESRPPMTAPAPTPARLLPAAKPGLLAALVSEFARTQARPASADQPSSLDDALQSLGGPPDLKAMGYFRSTWTQLSAERRLTQSLARVPAKAGPLNAQHLVHQTLAVMHELSPGYLERFLDYADTLMWLERAQTPSAAASASRPEAPKVSKTSTKGSSKAVVKRTSTRGRSR